ncbi:putative quinol monooxygenase [Fundidesulfovibrio terrae]|uniref:putative quinol monooxygenase n=1 Tax=Fundidesulfovibrio terrae TaxID=2922866 RepID=UPI001FAF2F22|nr:putative quinol monooxygenase [Fundidesulfovibrio terrae]
MNHVNVAATITAKPGREAEVEAILTGMVAPSRKDPGCVSYVLHRCLDNACVFVFFEEWESRELLGQHLETPHLLAWRAKAPELTVSMDVKVLEKI